MVGTGYLGATHAVCMSELGFTVVGLDVDEAKVASLGAGVVPFFEPGLEELLRKNLESGRLSFSTSFADAADADAHFLCVGTPQRADSPAADLSYLDSAMDQLLAAGLKPGALVIGKSTVPAGTAARLAARLAAEAPHAGLAWNPEFLREGFAVEDTLRPDRLVFGLPAADGGVAEAVLRTVYSQALEAGTPLVVADYATAELVKVAANSFLATKISFINAMAEVCEVAGADVTTLAKALSYDTRIGGRFLGAGVGFGGGCLPKDIRAFQARARELDAGHSVAFLAEVDAINLRRRARVVELATELVGGDVRGKRVAVFGAAFKPNSDDIRDSPALDVARALHAAGAIVTVCDPAAIPNAERRYPELRYDLNAVEAARDADVVLHLTEWAEFREVDPELVASVTRNPVIIDGRNTLDPVRWRQAGWTYHALGRPNV
ncbi:UDP-glucose/GDP-mannose dehydrogenase family protein [Frankia sp. CNm7]|uniref:UDP-glucose 6-dehydrogenase n=1 Tax=Frankia nepalensis TaxID=1836974 RepID=A0A937RJY4_9ACTN|nr:UDP-glucose/GDP-mannose dehydrogenase family protein [Frankia nepalensis]MBL7495338.1 UDP-glucose/GDP-mannose dehydrogenase family protein [Frankia nepalensis]MBL7513288.1 UDP-glucose/GDP-mannose dehydrogenase family protein [Frankia nepalensis]MBL7524475.1 UDP-glucose/GDP-mannose dehydrogenase family protein [Frankia nepalensis]MBL7627773.1 UDP-glucose/GDP-mannose dehydrogenase family protein [Frankia nepalensis]